jgi:putative membrane protein
MAMQPPPDSADRRTQLAADRTVFAAERTSAAWVRTGLAALASGVGGKKLVAGVIPEWMIWGVRTILVLFSAFSFDAAVWRQLFSGAPPPTPDTPRLPPALLVALSALISIWFGRTSGDEHGFETGQRERRWGPPSEAALPTDDTRVGGWSRQPPASERRADHVMSPSDRGRTKLLEVGSDRLKRQGVSCTSWLRRCLGWNPWRRWSGRYIAVIKLRGKL